MEDRRNYYRILQVQPEAPFELIRSSYRTLMGRLKCHPDLGGTHALATWLNRAYETLGDPRKRAEYDLHLLLRDRRKILFGDLPWGQPGWRLGKVVAWYSGKMRAAPEPTGLRGLRYDRRRMRRIEREGEVHYCLGRVGGRQKGTLVDLSVNGLRFLSAQKIAPYTHIDIESPQLTARATIRHCVERKTSRRRRFLSGAHFVTVQFHQSCGTFLSVKA